MRDRAGRWAAYSVTTLLYHDSWRQDHPWLLRSPPCFPYGGHQSHGEGSGHSGANHDGSGASFASSTTVSATCLVRVKGCRTNGDARPPIVGNAGGSQGAGKAISLAAVLFMPCVLVRKRFADVVHSIVKGAAQLLHGRLGSHAVRGPVCVSQRARPAAGRRPRRLAARRWRTRRTSRLVGSLLPHATARHCYAAPSADPTMDDRPSHSGIDAYGGGGRSMNEGRLRDSARRAVVLCDRARRRARCWS